MDTELRGQLKFDMPLVEDVIKALNATLGSADYLKAWSMIKTKVKSVRSSLSLLGYYICDDCNNAQSFPPKRLAQLSDAIHALDPYHITIGAPWARPWSLYQYGDDAGTSGL